MLGCDRVLGAASTGGVGARAECDEEVTARSRASSFSPFSPRPGAPTGAENGQRLREKATCSQPSRVPLGSQRARPRWRSVTLWGS